MAVYAGGWRPTEIGRGWLRIRRPQVRVLPSALLFSLQMAGYPLFHGEECAFTLDWAEWPLAATRPLVFCWEAFVSQGAHSASLTGADVEDAATAAKEFLMSEDDLEAANAVRTEHPLSMIGAAALWSGWATDLTVLREPALVIKPVMPYDGPILEPDRLDAGL
jgi:hypothetical protein